MVDKTALILAFALVIAACSDDPPRSDVYPDGGTEETGNPVVTVTTQPTDFIAYVEDALDFMEANHYRTDEVDWNSIRGTLLPSSRRTQRRPALTVRFSPP